MDWDWEDRTGTWAGRILTLLFIGAVLEVLLHLDDVIAVFKISGVAP